MALRVNVKNEDDELVDLNSKISSESYSSNEIQAFDSDLALNEYQASVPQEDTDIIHTLIEDASQPVYVNEDQSGQQFLTLSQGNNRIAVNDNGTIVYTNALPEEIKSDEYYDVAPETAEDAEYFQESDNITAEVISDVEDEPMLLGDEDVSELLDSSGMQYDQVAITPGTFMSKGDNMITIQRNKAVKRPIGSSSKMVYVQSSPKATTSAFSGRSMSIAQAQRLGILPPKIQQVLTASGNSQRIVVKKIVQPSNSNVVIRTPQKILPATLGTRDKITLTGLRPKVKINQAIRTNIPVSQLKTFLTTTTAAIRTPNKTYGGMTLQKVDGRTQQVVLRQGGISSSPSMKIPTQTSGKQHVKYVKVIGSGIVTAQKLNSTAIGKSILASAQKPIDNASFSRDISSDEETAPSVVKSRSSNRGNSLSSSKRDEKPGIVKGADGAADDHNSEDLDPVDNENSEFGPGSPQKLFEANGIRPKKPCNCTKSQCLKLYCECFANGEFCFECNCINCFNNIEHEEERQSSIKSCLDRNPAAFRSKIKVADSDDEDARQNNKGCNCKRSHCLKNYCECFETKVLCGKNCKCTSCRNNQDDLAAWVRGEDFDSGNEDREPLLKSAPYMSQALAEALCHCILAQAETSEQKGEDIVTTEQRIIAELGQRLVQIIGNRSKKDNH